MFKYLSETTHWDSGAQAIISDNRNILRVHSVVHFMSRGNEAIHVFVFCFISMIGLKQLFIGVNNKSTFKSTYVFLILLLFPSILFWTSSILKEPMMFLGIGFLVRAFWGPDTNNKNWLFGIFGTIVLFGFKPYVLIAMIPGILFYIFYRSLPKLKIIGSLLILISIVSSALLIFPKKREHVVHIFSRKQYDFKNVGKGGLHARADNCFYYFKQDQLANLKIEHDSVSILKTTDAQILQIGAMDSPIPITLHPSNIKWSIYFINSQSYGFIDLTLINDSFSQMLLNIPEALINSLIRPYPWDPGSWLKYPAALEVLLLYIFLIYAISKRIPLSKDIIAIIIAITLFVISLSLIIGWVTPVLGAIVRYRTPAIMGIIVIALILISPRALPLVKLKK